MKRGGERGLGKRGEEEEEGGAEGRGKERGRTEQGGDEEAESTE